MKIGLIGPGRMGRPMRDRLAADGHHVTALVRHPDAQKVAEAEGVIWADSVAATEHLDLGCCRLEIPKV